MDETHEVPPDGLDDAAEHLQRALEELIAAGRAVLDGIERCLEEQPDLLRSFVDGLSRRRDGGSGTARSTGT